MKQQLNLWWFASPIVSQIRIPATLKKVVKSVVQEEDRSKDVVIYGQSHKKEENVVEREGCIWSDRIETPTSS